MAKFFTYFLIIFFIPCLSYIYAASLNNNPIVLVGAENTQSYFGHIKNKRVALVVNQTSRVDNLQGRVHLIDFFLAKKIKLQKLFALEHGIRGDFDAGAEVTSTFDERSGLSIISLYGKNKKIKASDIKDVDVIIFDIQDIGVRFYTYISSLKYVLDACAEFNKKCIVLDRPNPNANNISGPVLDMSFRSFVGMFPIPVIYGLTIGELAEMMKGEKWVKTPLDLFVSPVKNWRRSSGYVLPVKPSPNLPNAKSIEIYPSLAPFEATNISVGRGTKRPFTHIGHPALVQFDYFFRPVSTPGASKYPLHENNKCFGLDLNRIEQREFTLKYIFNFYKEFKKTNRNDFFISESFFNKLIGNSYVLENLKKNIPFYQVERIWQKEIEKYKLIRQRYLKYE